MFEARMTMVCRYQQTEGFRLIVFPLFFCPNAKVALRIYFILKGVIMIHPDTAEIVQKSDKNFSLKWNQIDILEIKLLY